MSEKFQNSLRESEIKSLKSQLEKVAEDPILAALYSEIIQNNNFSRLQEKSEIQLQDLTIRYYENIIQEEDYLRKESKLSEFTDFVEELSPVRSDRNDFEEFLSPEQIGKVQNYGPQDSLIKAEAFVYGSFSDIGHQMSRHDQHVLDEEDIAIKAQIIMNDIANVMARVPSGETYLKKYIYNLFDYDNGKKILATYFASVFDNVQQVRDAFSYNDSQVAQRWEEVFKFHDTPTWESAVSEEVKFKRDEELTQLFVKRMKSLLVETGIEPPFSLEIRIKDSAKVKR